MKRNAFILILAILSSSCSSIYKDYDEKLLENKEFDNSVKITEMAPTETPPETVVEPLKDKPEAPAAKKPVKPSKKSAKGKKEAATPAVPSGPAKHEPALEDSANFDGRRPIVDPYVEGEELAYSVSYFAMEGGRLTIQNRPFVQVNGKKSYHFVYKARSSSVFSMFYAVDDFAETFLDYETLVPHSYIIRARESKQVRDVKAFFNWKSLKGKTWDKKIKKGKGPEEKNYEWDILPYSQNVFTVLFYLRSFEVAVGKELAVRVAHEGKNIIMKAKVLREESISTPVGKLDTYVLKPEFEIDGVFKPVGDVFLWITKDKYKRLARLESKVKIGTIVVRLEKITP